MIKYATLALLLTLAPLTATARDVLGTITILDGGALIYRAATRINAEPGLRLEATDIIETAESSFVQIELDDQSTLGIGPRSRLLVSVSSSGAERSVYAIEGWFKLSAEDRAEVHGPGLRLRSSLLDVPAQPSTMVIKIAAAEVTVFAETPESKLIERRDIVTQIPVMLMTGTLYRRTAGESGAIHSRAKGEFFSQMPASFKDRLPSRLDQFRNKTIDPKIAADFSYKDVEPWLKSEPALRKQFVERWQFKASDPEFRAALIANMHNHPEWDAILFPAKYPRKRLAPPRATP